MPVAVCTRVSGPQRQRRCGAAASEHGKAADRSDANQAAGSSQARHQQMPIGPLELAAARNRGAHYLAGRELAHGRIAQSGKSLRCGGA
jgi:hypothetical protein